MKSLKSELSRELKNKVDKELNNKGLHNPNSLRRAWYILFNNELHQINLRMSFFLEEPTALVGSHLRNLLRTW